MAKNKTHEQYACGYCGKKFRTCEDVEMHEVNEHFKEDANGTEGMEEVIPERG